MSAPETTALVGRRPARLVLGRHLVPLAGPVALTIVVGVASSAFSDSVQLQLHTALVTTAMVVGLSVFSGNSGIVSFGHVSFVGVGAFAAGIMSMPAQQKATVFPELFGFIRDNDLGNVASLALGALVGGIFALVVGTALVRLSGLGAGIATFAVLGITRNVLRNWSGVGPGAKAIPSIPQTTGLTQATVALLVCIGVAYAYQASRWGRRLRASREDPAAARGSGIGVYKERLIAFALSGAVAGFAGAVYVHLLGSVSVDQVYLELTFLTLAMLVVGGIDSLWGAVVGGLFVSLLNSLLFEGEKGLSVVGIDVTLPASSSNIAIAVVMMIVILVRPRGITGGRELRLRALRRPRRAEG